MVSFMEVLQTSCRSQNSSIPSPIYWQFYFEQCLHAGGIVAAGKKIQRVIDTINDGTLYLRVTHTVRFVLKRRHMQFRVL